MIEFFLPQSVAEVLGAYEILPSMDFFKLIGQQLCRDTSPIIAICESVLFLITGFNEKNLNAVSLYFGYDELRWITKENTPIIQENVNSHYCIIKNRN